MPVNMVLAKKQVATITTTLCKTAALPAVYIDLDRLYHVGQVLNPYLFSQVVKTCKYKTCILNLPERLLKYEAIP